MWSHAGHRQRQRGRHLTCCLCDISHLCTWGSSRDTWNMNDSSWHHVMTEDMSVSRCAAWGYRKVSLLTQTLKSWGANTKLVTSRCRHNKSNTFTHAGTTEQQNRQTVSSLRLQRSADCFWPLACRHTGCPQTSRVLLWYSHFQEAAVSVSTNISLVGTRSSSVTTEHFQLLRDSRLFPTEKETTQWVDFHRHRGQQRHANCVNNTLNHSVTA